MKIETQVAINGPATKIWEVITDIENAAATISGIEQIEVLEKPESGIVGLKWRETRTLFGKTATEVMWIVDAADNEFYQARAESHGCVYLSTLRISEVEKGCALTMSHEAEPRTVVAKLFSPMMGVFFKGAMRKLLQEDLEDIKMAVERTS